MKEILKHYEPPFVSNGARVIDSKDREVCDCSWSSSASDPHGLAQEIAAALNRAARLETLDELAEFSQTIGMYDSVEVEGE